MVVLALIGVTVYQVVTKEEYDLEIDLTEIESLTLTHINDPTNTLILSPVADQPTPTAEILFVIDSSSMKYGTFEGKIITTDKTFTT